MISLTQQELFWLAGYLEGEGSFIAGGPSNPTQPHISVCSTDEDVIAKVSALFETGYCKVKEKRNPKWKDVWVTRKRGYHAVELMLLLKPLMSIRRQKQINKSLSCYDYSKIRKLSKCEVEEIRKLCKTNMKQQEIGKLFGVKRETVNKIKNYKGAYSILK